jgi:succinylglutamate desuccinylase
MNNIPDNDFLALTRQNQLNLAPFSVEHDTCIVQVWDTGVIYFCPKHLSNSKNSKRPKAIVLSSAIHGNETAPIEICNDIITGLLTNTINLIHPTLFIYGNPPSINIGERFVEENLNRLFSGMQKGKTPLARDENKEQIRAAKLEGFVTEFFQKHINAERTHYDLHTAIRDSAHEKFAVYPFIHGKPWTKEQFEIVKSMGVTTFLLMQKPATTFSYYSSNIHGASSFTIELGKVRPFGENDQTKFAATKATLITLIGGVEVDTTKFDPSAYQFMSVHKEVVKHNESFKLTFADDVANFTAFNQGDVFATEDGTEIKADQNGEAIVFPNAHVANGQRALLTVVPTNIEDNLI